MIYLHIQQDLQVLDNTTAKNLPIYLPSTRYKTFEPILLQRIVTDTAIITLNKMLEYSSQLLCNRCKLANNILMTKATHKAIRRKSINQEAPQGSQNQY